jgi:uncharacterized protein (DUF2236 family)
MPHPTADAVPVAPERGPLRSLDNGFFGPDSVSWKVWTSPTSLIGFQRAVVLEHFDPPLAAAVADSGGIYDDPHGRLDQTLAYFLTVAVGDGRTAIQASEFLMRVHAQATGIEPITGKRYSANNPESQLWIHLTGWHSVLKCYELYGPGRLSKADEDRYWAECAIAAELQTCDPADVPRSREGVQAYFEAVRPRLCSSEAAHRGMHYLLRPPLKKVGFKLWAASRFTAVLSIHSLPRWMRETGGFHQWRLVDLGIKLARPFIRIGTRIAKKPWVGIGVIAPVAPVTGKVLRQHYRSGAPTSAETLTPAQARELYGQMGARRAS